MELIFIRHSMTAENLEYRYIGRRTDAPLCPEGIRLAQRQAIQLTNITPDLLFVSPMQRCRETASILFSNFPQIVISDLAECDFGQFEGKNYHDLSGNKAYQTWLDSGGMSPFPDGESREAFVHRCCQAIEQLVQMYSFSTAVVVAHGGTCMAVLSEMEESHTPYFDWNIPYCVPLYCRIMGTAPLRLKCKKRGNDSL